MRRLLTIALIIVIYGAVFTALRANGWLAWSGVFDVLLLSVAAAAAVYVSRPVSAVGAVVVAISTFAVGAVVALTIVYSVFGDSF